MTVVSAVLALLVLVADPRYEDLSDAITAKLPWMSSVKLDGWRLVVVGSDLKSVAYAKSAPSKVGSPYLRAWMRSEYAPGEIGGLSSSSLFEIDCREMRYHILQVNAYAQHNLMGGVATITEEVVKWDYVSPGSIAEFLVTDTCPKTTASSETVK